MRESTAKRESQYEYGAEEVGTIHGDKETKCLIEGNIKLPKVLKDMLDSQVSKKGLPEGLKAFGVLHCRLSIKTITADRPSKNVTRIIRGKELRIPSNLKNFGPEALPVIVQIWKLK